MTFAELLANFALERPGYKISSDELEAKFADEETINMDDIISFLAAIFPGPDILLELSPQSVIDMQAHSLKHRLNTKNPEIRDSDIA